MATGAPPNASRGRLWQLPGARRELPEAAWDFWSRPEQVWSSMERFCRRLEPSGVIRETSGAVSSRLERLAPAAATLEPHGAVLEALGAVWSCLRVWSRPERLWSALAGQLESKLDVQVALEDHFGAPTGVQVALGVSKLSPRTIPERRVEPKSVLVGP